MKDPQKRRQWLTCLFTGKLFEPESETMSADGKSSTPVDPKDLAICVCGHSQNDHSVNFLLNRPDKCNRCQCHKYSLAAQKRPSVALSEAQKTGNPAGAWLTVFAPRTKGGR